jgi:hypothetical protein
VLIKELTMVDPFQALLDSALKNNQFPTGSRYYGLTIANYIRSDGKTMVVQGERLDHLSAKYLGDPEQYWRICDANDAIMPDALVEPPDRTLKISLPEGFTGLPNA